MSGSAARVIVIGAGMAGLTAALELSQAGVEVLVLEGSERVGGKLRLESVAGRSIDVGAESALAVRPEFTDLMHRLGAQDRLTTPATTTASIWSRGGLHPMPAGTLMGIPADPGHARGILTDEEVARLARDTAQPLGEAVDVAVGTYVAARLGDAVVDRLLDPLLGGVYAGDARALSMRATTPQLWAAAAGPSLTAAAPGPQPSRRPSPFAGVIGGFGSVPTLLADHLTAAGVRIETGSVVQGLSRGSDWQVRVRRGTEVETMVADAVVLAVPAAPAARLLRDVAPRAGSELAGIDYASMAIISAAFDTAAIGDLPGSGFLVPVVEGWTIKASTFSSRKWGWLDGDVTFLRASIGRAGDVAALQAPDEALVEVALREVGQALGRPLPEALDVHVQRWGGGLPQYAPGHLDRIAAIRADVRRLPRLALAGAAYDGVGIPAVIASGRSAAEQLQLDLN